MYRTFDGSCNNLKEPLYGRAETPFQRILKEAAYNKFNGMYLFMNNIHFMISNVLILNIGKIGEPRVAKNGLDLPSARVVSLECTQKENKVPKSQKGIETVLVMQMGQFIDHDITHAPQFRIENCCDPSKISLKCLIRG